MTVTIAVCGPAGAGGAAVVGVIGGLDSVNLLDAVFTGFVLGAFFGYIGTTVGVFGAGPARAVELVLGAVGVNGLAFVITVYIGHDATGALATQVAGSVCFIIGAFISAAAAGHRTG